MTAKALHVLPNSYPWKENRITESQRLVLLRTVGFEVLWCDEKMRFVGICSYHPLYACYGDSAEEAMGKIIALVRGLDLDNETTDVEMSVGLADTQEITNTCWPPFIKLP